MTLVDPELEQIMKAGMAEVYRIGDYLMMADEGSTVWIARGKARDAEQLEIARWQKVTN